MAYLVLGLTSVCINECYSLDFALEADVTSKAVSIRFKLAVWHEWLSPVFYTLLKAVMITKTAF
jgi:hypothetical protein